MVFSRLFWSDELGVETRETKYHCHPILSRMCLTHHDVPCAGRAGRVFPGPPPRVCPPPPPPFLPCCLFGRKLTVTEWGVTLHLLQAVIATYIVWNSAGDIYSFSHVFISVGALGCLCHSLGHNPVKWTTFLPDTADIPIG